MPKYEKPFLSLGDQIALLQQRGLAVTDEETATACLKRNGYYRISAYWYPFRKIENGQRTDIFLQDSRFEDAMELYLFDKAFKLHLLDALERIEIATRVEIALLLGKRDAHALENRRLFHKNFVTRSNRNGEILYDAWHEKYEIAVQRARDEFVLHHEEKYGARLPLPIWIGIELWDFGLLSHLYSGLKINDKQRIAQTFGVPDWQLMESWLRVLNYVRNVIAHHGRLWNLYLRESPRLPSAGQIPEFDHLVLLPKVNKRLYSVCCIVTYLSQRINSQSQWSERFITLLEEFPIMPHCHIRNMGFPADWSTQTLWQ